MRFCYLRGSMAMMQLHLYIKTSILQVVDFFYAPFKNFLPLQTFRYAACGGANTLFDICLFAINYNLVFQKQNVVLGSLTISPHIAAFLTAFIISFPTGFYLSRYVVFTESAVRGRIQLFRYFIVVLVCFLLNYLFLKLFVEYIGWYPTISKMITTVFVVVFSYVSQTYFSFGIRRRAASEVSL